MSMKILNGLKFNSSNFEIVYKQLVEIKDKCSENANKALNNQAINILLDIKSSKKYSEFALNTLKELDENKIGFDLAKKIIEICISSILSENNGLSVHTKYICDVIVVPYHGEIYGIEYFNGLRPNLDLIYTIADEYCYQNQSDPPSCVSRKEYEKRGKVWNKIMEKTDIPINFGFLFRLTDLNKISISDELMNEIISINKN